MTPMVDLGFLLITFFIFTSTMATDKATRLIIPAHGPSNQYPESGTLTVILGKNNEAYAYGGIWEEAVQTNGINRTGYHVQEGLGRVIRERQQWLGQRMGPGGRDTLLLLIKPTEEATYKNLMDALDEVQINGVKRYAVVSPSEAEKAYALKQVH